MLIFKTFIMHNDPVNNMHAPCLSAQNEQQDSCIQYDVL